MSANTAADTEAPENNTASGSDGPLLDLGTRRVLFRHGVSTTFKGEREAGPET